MRMNDFRTGYGEGRKMNVAVKLGVVVVIAIVSLIILSIINPMVKIGAGQRGVVLVWGAVSNDVLGEGIHWVTPIAQSVVKMDVTRLRVVVNATASSKDLQSVSTQVVINYHLDPTSVNWIYQQYQNDYKERVIVPAMHEFIKKTTAEFTAEELVKKREAVKNDLTISLKDSLSKSKIFVDDVFITDFKFDDQFNAAIEAKVTAEQQALMEKNNLEKVKYEAQQTITQAEAAARAIQIQAQAITQQGGREYVNLKAVEKWDGKLPTQMIPGQTLPFIQLGPAR